MPRNLSLAFGLACLATTVACGGGGGGGNGNGGGGSGPTDPSIYVDAVYGSDTNGDGSRDHPYKSITRGISDAGFGDTIRVAAGRYDAANGETFPLPLGFGTTLIGTEISNPGGAGVTRLTHVVGGGLLPGDSTGRLHATIAPQDDCTI